MQLRKMYFLLLVLPMLFVFNGCSKDDPVSPPPAVDEAQVLADYLEAQGDFVNTAAPAMTTAEATFTNLGASQYVIDIRSAESFAAGHIQGAVNVALADIVTHVSNLAKTTTYDRVVIVCYTGQTAGYATSLLRMLGFNNVYDMKWGMASWNSATASSWVNNAANNYTNFVTDVTAKGAAGDLPTLSTGETTGADILTARISSMLSTDNPFGDVATTWSAVTSNPNDYYIINYWPLEHYNLGHIPGAIQYTPNNDFKVDQFLNTLPTDKKIVVYCYTGQTSAHIAAFLKVLGYEAYSLKFGVNTMNNDWLATSGAGHQFTEAAINDYDLVQ